MKNDVRERRPAQQGPEEGNTGLLIPVGTNGHHQYRFAMSRSSEKDISAGNPIDVQHNFLEDPRCKIKETANRCFSQSAECYPV